jgi:hypothetical protein
MHRSSDRRPDRSRPGAGHPVRLRPAGRDRLSAADPDVERVATGIVSIAAMTERLKLSRSHLTRKLGAEAPGSIGWQGKRGQSVMWVSAGFRREYATAQAVKLAIIDAAFAACFCRVPAQPFYEVA